MGHECKTAGRINQEITKEQLSTFAAIKRYGRTYHWQQLVQRRTVVLTHYLLGRRL